MTIIITLSFAGNETGPFDLYSDATGFAIPFAQNVSKAALLAGYQVEAPDGTTVVRLDNLNSLCGSTDIYSCATPNCDFTGSIICDVTTTTTTTAELTTTTTTAYPGVVPCTWSTYGGNSGEIAVYDFDTNSSTVVLVPNDFTTTTGINRPICSTGDKLWLASVTINNTSAYIREWDIDTSGATPTLSYVREITVNVSNLSSTSIYGRTISTIAVTGDNNTLLVGFGAKDNGSNGMGVYSWDISTSGDIALSEFNKIDKAGTPFGNTSGITTELTGMFITNDDNVILSARYYEDESPNNAANLVRQFQGLPSNVWLDQIGWPIINLQQSGVPEFTTAWTNPSKAMPAWGVNGLLQVIQPETLQVYNIDQIGPYNATLSGTVADDSVWIHTSTGCANVDIIYEDCEEATWIPALTEQVDGEWVYTGPATFTYAGIEVTASATQDNMKLRSGNSPGGIPTAGCSGISNPPGNNILKGLRGFDFTITLSFSQPVNNIPIRAAILNTQPDFSAGDVYTFDTNTGTPNVSISVGCNVQVQGNSIGGGVPDYNTEGDGEFIITSDTPFTILTISGDAPTGGPLLLGCAEPPLNCNRIFSEPNQGRDCTPGVCAPQNNWPPSGPQYKKFYSHNVVTGVIEEIIFPAASAFTTPNSGVSETYLINQLALTNAEGFTTSLRFARYRYDESSTGVPQNLDWDGIVYEIDKNDLPGILGNFVFGLSTINDDVISLNYQRTSGGGGGHMVIEAQFVPGSTTLAITEKFVIPEPFNGGSEHVVTLKEDGTTPNKFIALRSNEPVIISQFDYVTGNFEGEVELSALGNPENYRTRGDMSVIGDFLYISITDLPNNNTDLWKVSFDTLEWSIAESDDSYNGGSSGSKPSCRISNGFTSFDPPPSTTTTTTTLLDGVNTIFSRFNPSTPV